MVRVRAVDAPAAQLGLAAGSIAGLFALLVVTLPVWAGQPARPPAADASTTTPPAGWAAGALTLAFVAVTCLPFRPYCLAQRSLRRASVSARLVLALTVVLAVVAALIYPAFGGDVFDYVGFERMWVVYGDNPLLALPVQHPLDWSTAYVWYPDRTPAYGPLWAILTWPIVRLAGDSPAAEVAGYKLLAVAAYAACCWLIWTSAPPARRQRALVAFAWSPLTLLEVLGKVHNDILPAVGLLAAVWLLSRRARHPHRLSPAAVTAGALVKVTALVAAPPLALYLWRRSGWRTVVASLVVALVLAVGLYAPFWAGPRTLASIWNQTSRLDWSPISLLSVASSWLPGGPAPLLARALCWLVWLGASAWLVLRGPTRRASDLATTSGWVLVLSVLLLTSAVYGHYFVPAVALAAVSDDHRLQRLVLWLSVGGQAANAVDLLGLACGPAWLGSDAYRVVGTVCLLAPAALMLLPRPSGWRGARLAPAARVPVGHGPRLD